MRKEVLKRKYFPEFHEKYERNADNILCAEEAGYWSNLDENENDDFIEAVQCLNI